MVHQQLSMIIAVDCGKSFFLQFANNYVGGDFKMLAVDSSLKL